MTGERALFVNPGFTSHIVDVTPRESAAILDLLYAEITRHEYTVRFRWEPGSVAFWDNRATAHLAPADLDHLLVEPERFLGERRSSGQPEQRRCTQDHEQPAHGHLQQ